ncbi:granulocyte colony-stimulating factor receptor-like isoform X2 [Pygocentrus nattereri]|uniref:granulocyte colony-stimulating factor receptor-like isoform X2 n=1 Tax=Pygocentrus nattereri TaxID=42514 RepID=UPI001891C2A0|nr:granulocyte colony-stimulating factor receptor-like isoform X2 [Pygocentrus nattereri]
MLNLIHTTPCKSTWWKSDQCTSSLPRCSVPVSSLNRIYCIQVFAHSDHHPTVSSDMLCLNGTDAVKLPPPEQFWLIAENGSPRCLRLRWSPPKNFPLTTQKINSSYLLYQLQNSTADQNGKPLDVDLREELQCVFLPCTQYSLKMRYRYNHNLSHWSDWSPTTTIHTDVQAPSSVPQLWWTVQPADAAGFRRVTLLWKAALETACTAWFSVQCPAAVDLGDCTNLSLANRSCHLIVPRNTCICTFSMFNFAGSAPPASITISSQWQTVNITDQTSLISLQVTSLNDSSVEVQWRAMESPTITGFVVEWCITESTQCQRDPHWHRVGNNTNKVIITEGVEPNTPYSISVRAVYGVMSDPGLTVLAYSRQAAPSAGPKLYVAENSCLNVMLRWSPVPLALRNGFITRYTLHYQNENDLIRELHMPVDWQQYKFLGVSGQYRFYMKAHTEAGTGPAGPVLTVFLGPCTSMHIALLSGCVFIAGFSILLCMCWRMRWRIKQNIWPKVPNPALSSLSDWL